MKNLCNASFFSKLDSNAASSPPELESATSSGDPPPNSSKNSCTSEVELSESLKNEITLNYLKTAKNKKRKNVKMYTNPQNEETHF